MQTKILKVPEMHCGHCEAAVKGALSALDGVTGEVRLPDREVEVRFEPSRTPLASIVQAIEDQGYDVVDPAEG